MAADVLDILTLAEGKLAVGITSSDNSLNDKLEGYITGTSRTLDEYLGPVVVRNRTDYLSGQNRHGARLVEVCVHQRPVSSYTTVTEYSTTGTAQVLSAEDFDTKPAEGYLPKFSTGHDSTFYNGILRRRQSGFDAWWEMGQQNIVVVYVAGRFATTATVDRNYKRACAIALENFWRDTQIGTVTFDEYDVPKVSFPTFALPRAVKEMFPQTFGQHLVGGFA